MFFFQKNSSTRGHIYIPAKISLVLTWVHFINGPHFSKGRCSHLLANGAKLTFRKIYMFWVAFVIAKSVVINCHFKPATISFLITVHDVKIITLNKKRNNKFHGKFLTSVRISNLRQFELLVIVVVLMSQVIRIRKLLLDGNIEGMSIYRLIENIQIIFYVSNAKKWTAPKKNNMWSRMRILRILEFHWTSVKMTDEFD